MIPFDKYRLLLKLLELDSELLFVFQKVFVLSKLLLLLLNEHIKLILFLFI